MSVDTLLRKEKDGTLTKQSFHEQIPGGLAAGKKPSQFNAGQLSAGRKVEMEHTKSPAIATEIAMDHLTEDPGYYPKLRRMEHESEKKSSVLDDSHEAKMRVRLARMAERRGEPVTPMTNCVVGKLAAAATEQANAVYQEYDPKNPTITPPTKFRRGDVPAREDIPGRTGAEYRPDVSGSTASRGLAPEGYGGY